jgi:AraC-like DNA-binding protein
MRAFYETIAPEPGSSWAFLDRRLPDGIPFEWHYHPEYELTLTLNSRGHRYVGDDVDVYTDGDLVLIGPGIAHSWCSQDAIDGRHPHVALVCWFTHAWVQGLISGFPEMEPITHLLARAPQGVQFGAPARDRVAPLMEEMRNSAPARRLLLLLEVLTVLRQDTDARVLANAPQVQMSDLASDERILRVLNYLHLHYAEPVRVETLAGIACVSLSAFHRMFRRHARVTMLDYLMRLRIGRACSLLIGTSTAISAIAADVGYTNLSLFNRQFIRSKGQTPSQFRKHHTELLARSTPARLSMDRS